MRRAVPALVALPVALVALLAAAPVSAEARGSSAQPSPYGGALLHLDGVAFIATLTAATSSHNAQAAAHRVAQPAVAGDVAFAATLCMLAVSGFVVLTSRRRRTSTLPPSRGPPHLV